MQVGTMSVGDADEQNSAVSLATGLHSLGGGPPRSVSTSRVGECRRCRVAHLAMLLHKFVNQKQDAVV